MMNIKYDANIQFTTKPDTKGFVVRKTGNVTDIVDGLIIVRVKSQYAYHPDNIEGGRFLPIPPPYKWHGRDFDPALEAIESELIDSVEKFDI